MKSTWNGRIVSETANSALHCWLVLHPVDTLTPQLQKNLARILGIDEIDVRVKVRTGGYITIAGSDNIGQLQTKADGLKQLGLNSSVFKEYDCYDVPEQETAHSGAVNGGSYRFKASNGGQLAEIDAQDRLLFVSARLNVNNVTSYTTGVPANTKYRNVQILKSLGNSKYSVLDIYNFTKNKCIRLVEGNFNFREILVAKITYSFTASVKFLIEQFKSGGFQFTIDECYDNSLLPLPDKSYSKQSTDRPFINSPSTTKVSSDELERFSGYSRFRYIVETTKT